ncbi:MAG: HAD family phosphatase [Candidatus Omnitrophica bacterium]|nr:HAD family phosphatase [Candidatus Omnitrophota bacterium]MBU4488412.1 HAD family phosphatase [Candidatus Omnitrophota bacterium]MCG2704928.1 HAD family phosphatase [Candidatus Omnitrophota bacterium]
MKNRKSKPEAIIFDMDGVIIDSMPYHFLAWYEALRPLGVRVSCFEVYSKEGEDWKKTLREFLKKAGIKPTEKILSGIFRRRKKIFKKNFKRFIFKGAKEVLVCLKKKDYLLGLVTGTPKKEVKKILPVSMYRLFDCIVAGDEVKKGKPHPEPYLRAAKLMDVKPSECVVVENAPFGVESAKKAGMFCIAVTTGLTKEYLKGADIIVDDLSDMIEAVENRGVKCLRKFL